jgi:16S rRNA (guanine(966)-N(2))-methyltransferase RsmD
MRVIAGALKGRVLQTPAWEGLRPTSDRLRETVFNILAPRIEGVRFLDVCAGTGAVGIEALSRGAARVTFVEEDRRAVALIEANRRRCPVRDGYTIERRDALARPGVLTSGPFDIVFLDPPYAQRTFDPWLRLAALHLAPDGIVVLEHSSRLDAPARVDALAATRRLRQGDSALTFYAAGSAVTEGE